MKNIHVLPTDKPSRLVKGETTGRLLLHNTYGTSTDRNETQNIYITSDEEIKEGDYYLELDFNIIYKFTSGTFTDINSKKIILTTDKDLDGVQTIPDNFLEWFVKNPSCEEVQVERFHGINTSIAEINAISGDGSLNWQGKSDLRDYKIIIPKEEPKNICIQTGLPCGMQCLSEETCNTIKTKQETLEDIAQWVIEFRITKNEYAKVSDFEMYHTIIEKVSKWQQERSYSKEEIETIAKDAYAMGRKGLLIGVFNKWFEQFKK